MNFSIDCQCGPAGAGVTVVEVRRERRRYAVGSVPKLTVVGWLEE